MKRLLCLLLCVIMIVSLLGIPTVALEKEDIPSDAFLLTVAEQTLARKRRETDTDSSALLNEFFLRYAGTTAGDWYPFVMGRLSVGDRTADYLAVLRNEVERRYAADGQLDSSKATEWHRISLAFLSLGEDPQRLGEIDLITDGVWNRIDSYGEGSLGQQGINGYIWGLITVDSLFYAEPSDAVYTRESILTRLLSMQLEDGGWSLSGTESESDITAMVLQALAPYQNSEILYGGRHVREAIDKALLCLQEMQNTDGSFSGHGKSNCGSTAQVMIAMCSLGIDPFADPRFCVNGHTVWDGLMCFALSDGGFSDALGGAFDSRSSEQALCAIASVLRERKGARRLYDCRTEQSEATRAQISSVEEEIRVLGEDVDRATVSQVYEHYLAIEADERSYVTGYAHLSELLAKNGIAYSEEQVCYGEDTVEAKSPIQPLSDADISAIMALSDPNSLTTKDRPTVLRLWYQLQKTDGLENRAEAERILQNAKARIDSLLAEITQLKTDIQETLYPLSEVGLDDRSAVNRLYDRYCALAEYDRTWLSEYDREGLLRAKEKTDTAYRTFLITVACVAVLGTVVLTWGLSLRRRRLRKRMPESDE